MDLMVGDSVNYECDDDDDCRFVFGFFVLGFCVVGVVVYWGCIVRFEL